jgi:diadenosine tetraphosphatase ApaH/serine/threonine PP2A family protein phosphatase
MTLTIISDIHGNLEALEAVLATPQWKKADSVVCLGDVVGYGADPDACVERLRKDRRVTCLMGNHDWGLLRPESRDSFNDVARKALEWTEREIKSVNRKYLEGLALTHRFGDHLAVHASPFEPEHWHYILSDADINRALEAEEYHACFVGHTHMPFLFGTDGTEPDDADGTFDLVSDHRYVINVGSVGQPRDEDPRASFVTLDLERGKIRFHRVDYDVEEAGRKIVEADLPGVLAERLVVGH